MIPIAQSRVKARGLYFLTQRQKWLTQISNWEQIQDCNLGLFRPIKVLRLPGVTSKLNAKPALSNSGVLPDHLDILLLWLVRVCIFNVFSDVDAAGSSTALQKFCSNFSPDFVSTHNTPTQHPGGRFACCTPSVKDAVAACQDSAMLVSKLFCSLRS